MQKDEIQVVGLMSGTSLDGLDVVLVTFSESISGISFRIEKGITVSFPETLREKLSGCMSLSAFELAMLDREFGAWCGQEVKAFLNENRLNAQLISSHGHTVFHQPKRGLTLQIGHGAEIAARSGIPVVCDFRTADVAKGGQGAPLVPVGDRILFSEYTACLNLGGIANISFEKEEHRLASDLCPFNLVMNHFAAKRGHTYDPGGKYAAAGSVDDALLSKLNDLDFYHQPWPKSLGREWIDEVVIPLAERSGGRPEDVLRTFAEHAVIQVARFLPPGKTLVTGGGAYNAFFIERLREISRSEIVVPEKNLVEFKEALIFALLGYLRWNGEINILQSVTGASGDSCSGAIYL